MQRHIISILIIKGQFIDSPLRKKFSTQSLETGSHHLSILVAENSLVNVFNLTILMWHCINMANFSVFICASPPPPPPKKKKKEKKIFFFRFGFFVKKITCSSPLPRPVLLRKKIFFSSFVLFRFFVKKNFTYSSPPPPTPPPTPQIKSFFLALPSTKCSWFVLMGSYCDQSLSVVHRPCVVNFLL